MVENVGVAVGIASPCVSFQKLFLLPVSWPTHAFPMLAEVGPCWQCHIYVGHGRKYGSNRWNCIAISASGLIAAISHSGCRSMSDNVRSAISKSGVVENVGVAVEIFHL